MEWIGVEWRRVEFSGVGLDEPTLYKEMGDWGEQV